MIFLNPFLFAGPSNGFTALQKKPKSCAFGLCPSTLTKIQDLQGQEWSSVLFIPLNSESITVPGTE